VISTRGTPRERSRVKEIEGLRVALVYVLGKLPKTLQSDPAVQKLTAVSRRGALSLARTVNRHNSQSSGFKDYEFSRVTVTDPWDDGRDDA
jgi:NTE family protein